MVQVELLTQVLVLGTLVMLSTGCSHFYVDADGRGHVIGLVALTLPAPEGRIGAETLRIHSVGITLTRSPVGDALVIGYSDNSITAVHDHSLVVLPPGTQP